MRRSNQIKIASACLSAAALVGYGLYSKQKAKPESPSPVTSALEDLASPGPQVVPSGLVQPSAKSADVAGIPLKKNKGLPRPETIQKFKLIQTKVFKTDEDQKIFKKMISDTAYILQLKDYLKSSESTQEVDFRFNQNLAIDLIVEAFKSGDSKTASEAILEIIKDPQVEDENLNQRVRESFAGIKAELLYQSSSIDPQIGLQFEQILPGPVSQKIWKNVQQQQSDNLALSEAELQSRSAQKNQ